MNRKLEILLRTTIAGSALIHAATFSSVALAAGNDEAFSQDESAVRKIARQRLYPGGADVEPLKVQAQLPVIKKDGDNEALPPEPADVD